MAVLGLSLNPLKLFFLGTSKKLNLSWKREHRVRPLPGALVRLTTNVGVARWARKQGRTEVLALETLSRYEVG